VPRKIQSICNGKLTPITMQAIARAREKPPAQEQWRAMEKTMRRAMETMKNPGADLRAVVTPEDRQRRCARLAAKPTAVVFRIRG
jgi:hypothetical protein